MGNVFRKTGNLVETVETFAYNYHESEMETRTRQERGFNDTESTLPDLRASPAKDDRPSKTDDALSHLGTHNPHPHNITDNDVVWLFDNTAFRSATTHRWEAEFVTAVFDKDTGLEISTVVANIAEKVGIGKGDAAEATIRERLMPFMQSVLPGRIVNVDFAHEKDLKFGPCGRNGINSIIKALPKHGDGDVVPCFATVPAKTNGILRMKTVYAEPEGWGVISGIEFHSLPSFARLQIPQISMIPSKSPKQATPLASCALRLCLSPRPSKGCQSYMLTYRKSYLSQPRSSIFLPRRTISTLSYVVSANSSIHKGR